MKQTDLAWCAGLFDGEGCISISRVKPTAKNKLVNSSYRLVAKVTMGDRKAIRRFFAVVGHGSVQKHVEGNAKVNGSTSWVAAARKAEIVLKKLYPFLTTKLKEADIALEFMALPDPIRGGARGSPCIDKPLLRKKHKLYVRCCRAKPRFRFRKKPLSSFKYTPHEIEK